MCKQPLEVFTYVALEKSLFLVLINCDSSGIVGIPGLPSETLIHALKQEMIKSTHNTYLYGWIWVTSTCFPLQNKKK